MTKRVLNRILYILLLSGFNTLYKYVLVNETINGYNNSYFIGSYLKIFIISLIALLLIDFWRTIVTYFVNDRKFGFETIIICIFKHYTIIIGILIALAILLINYYLSLIILFISFIVYLIRLKKSVALRTFIVSVIFLIITLTSLWFISY